jgi:uncharacterized membrane protein
MWIVAVIVVAAIFVFAAGRILVARHRERQSLAMRDHLNRISRNWE